MNEMSDYLCKHPDDLEGVRVMALCRIADYLEIIADRIGSISENGVQTFGD